MTGTQKRLKNLWILFSLYVLIFIFVTNGLIILSILPVLSKEMNLYRKEGLLISIYSFMAASFTLLAGPISDKIGRKKTIVISSISFGITLFFSAFAWDFYSLFLFRLLQGIFASPIIVSAYSFIADYYPQEQLGKKFGILTSAMFLGNILGVPFTNYLSFYLNWKICFVLYGILVLLLGIIINFTFPLLHIHKEKESLNLKNILTSYKKLLIRKEIYCLLVFIFIISIAQSAPISYISEWFYKAFKYNLKEIGNIFFVAGCFSFLASLFAGITQKSARTIVLIFFTSCFSFIFSFLFLMNSNSIYYAVLFIILSFFSSFRLVSLQFLSNLNVQSHERASMSALFTGSGLMGSSIGAIFGSWFLNSFEFFKRGDGFQELNAASAGLFIFSLVFLFKINK